MPKKCNKCGGDTAAETKTPSFPDEFRTDSLLRNQFNGWRFLWDGYWTATHPRLYLDKEPFSPGTFLIAKDADSMYDLVNDFNSNWEKE